MSQEDEIRRELRAEAPKLAKLKKERVSAPRGYFEEMQSAVLAEIAKTTKTPQSTEEPTVETPIHQLSPAFNWRPYAVAASIALLVVLGVFMALKSNHGNDLDEMSEVAESTFSDEEYLLAIEDDIFYDVYAESMADAAADEEDPIIEYLLDNDFEINDLTNIN